MAYDQETQALALDMAMVALKALERAAVTSNTFRLFSMAYGLVRKLKVILGELRSAPILSPKQKSTLNRLAASYTREVDRGVLVHGDLHAGNLLVNCEDKSLGFVDLEMLHVGKSATNFAQLWISFHFADASLGKLLYQRCLRQFADVWDEDFDSDVRAEVALRSYVLVRGAGKTGHTELEVKSRRLLNHALGNQEFREWVLSSEDLAFEGKMHEKTQSLCW